MPNISEQRHSIAAIVFGMYNSIERGQEKRQTFEKMSLFAYH